MENLSGHPCACRFCRVRLTGCSKAEFPRFKRKWAFGYPGALQARSRLAKREVAGRGRGCPDLVNPQIGFDIFEGHPMSNALNDLLTNIRSCRLCAADLPHGPRPVLQAGSTARLRIVGQAPGRKVHESGVPWNDASGDRLRGWIGISSQDFYDPRKVAIIPVGFCYPGKAASGDNPPRSECAPQWHEALERQLPNIRLTLLVGQYAQVRYLGARRKGTLTDTVRSWEEYLPLGFVPLPHPSPRNQPWLVGNPWFETCVLSGIRTTIDRLEI